MYDECSVCGALIDAVDVERGDEALDAEGRPCHGRCRPERINHAPVLRDEDEDITW